MAKRGGDTKRELKSFRNLMTFQLHRLGNSSQRFSEEYYGQLSGLTLVECRVVGILAGLGTGTFKEVCELVRLDKSFGSRVIGRLTENGIVTKADNPSDKRSVMLCLTERGEQLQDELHAAGLILNREMTAPLSDAQLHTFMECLHLISARLDDMEQSGIDRVGKVPVIARTAKGHVDEDGVALRLDLETAQTLHQLLGRMLNQ